MVIGETCATAMYFMLVSRVNRNDRMVAIKLENDSTSMMLLKSKEIAVSTMIASVLFDLDVNSQVAILPVVNRINSTHRSKLFHPFRVGN